MTVTAQAHPGGVDSGRKIGLAWLGLSALAAILIAIAGWLTLMHMAPGGDELWGSGMALVILLFASLALGAASCVLVLRRDAQRRHAEEEMAQQNAILQSILDNLGDGVATADEHGRLSLFNPAAERILGLGRTDSGPEEWPDLYGLFHPDTMTPVRADELPLAQAVAGKECRDVEMFVRNPKLQGGVFIRVTATPIKSRSGALKGGVAVFRDITERKWTEAVLRDSEARFRSIVETTGSALIILSPDHRILEFNREAERISGRSRGEVVGEDYFDLFIPPEFREVIADEIKNVLAGKTSLGVENPIKSTHGTARMVLWSFSRLTDASGRSMGVIATGHDITERREAEEALRVRQLAAHLHSAREGERAHIAREIHDELGQALTGLKLEVSHLSRRLPAEQSELRGKLGAIQQQIDATIGTVRRIATTLRPQILDKLGLVEAIKWQTREFEKRMGISCTLELPVDEIRWSQDQSTAMFRVLQESLTNVARHAEASRVVVRMSKQSGLVVLEVEDDGRGITDDEIANSRSFGLLSMRERVRIFGGAIEIVGRAGKGTTVRVRMPD